MQRPLITVLHYNSAVVVPVHDHTTTNHINCSHHKLEKCNIENIKEIIRVIIFHTHTEKKSSLICSSKKKTQKSLLHSWYWYHSCHNFPFKERYPC
uniref:Uncharacterized protein n=1 Tax=Anguilla anguilla TaxID=7936 RepID=A0A0E9Q718_ANGAN